MVAVGTIKLRRALDKKTEQEKEVLRPYKGEE